MRFDATIKIIPVSWTAPEAEALRTIRFTVFCDEQKVPREIELDDIDPIAHHVLGIDVNGNPVATGRLFADPDDPGGGRIGRMAVIATERGRGYGGKILAALMREGLRRGYVRLTLHAQVQAEPFYARYGFVAEDPVFDEAGIAHRTMRATAEQARRHLGLPEPPG